MKFNLKYLKFLRIEKENQRRIFFSVVLIGFFLFRLIGDTVFFYLDYKISNIHYIWNTITSAGVIAFLFLIVFYPLKDFYSTKNLHKSDDEFFNDLYKSIIIIVLMLFLSLFTDLFFFANNKTTLISIYIFNLIVLLNLIGLLYITKIFKEWILHRRVIKTNSYLKRIQTLLLITIGLVIVRHWVGEEIKSFFSFVIFALITTSIILFWQIINRNDWIYNLAKKSKVRLFWLAGSLLFLQLIVLVLILDEYSDFSGKLFKFSELTQNIFLILMFFNFVFILRIWFVTISSLPNADIVERKSSELSSLAYLNSFVTNSVDKDIDYILSTVTGLAINSSRATGGWCEYYTNNEIKIIEAINFHEDDILALHSDNSLTEYFKKLNEPKLIQTVSEDIHLAPLDFYSKEARSLLIIPIIAISERIGTLVLTNVYEFGFDSNELIVMSAFSSNLKIAIENAKLMKDSIEKEKYKNELILARNIQQKLLPQTLPIFDKYSISAFNLPATEVGGDYYDIVTLKNGNPCIIVGDVSGKGISAAFYMAQLKGVVLSHSKNSSNAKDLLSKVNDTLFGNMEKQMYITISAIVLDLKGNSIDFCRAGHMPLIVNKENQINLYTPKGLGIGLVNCVKFNNFTESIEINIKKNDSLLLFTDGVNELQLSNNEEFGYEPLKKALINNTNANSIINSIKSDILKKKGDLISHDDMTLVSVVRI